MTFFRRLQTIMAKHHLFYLVPEPSKDNYLLAPRSRRNRHVSPPSGECGSGASGQSSGGPLNEDFWTSIAAEKEDSSFLDVFCSRISPIKTETQSGFSSSVTPSTPSHPSTIESSSSRGGGNCSGSATARSMTPTKFKFTSILESQVSFVTRTQ